MSIDRNAVTVAPVPAHDPPRAAMPTLDPCGDQYGPPPPGAPAIEGYRILAKLGQGGMGTVWRAVQLSTRREVALKLLVVSGSTKAKARFEREVELAAMLEHPNLARVYDSGAEQGLYYYAMELIEGMHLDTWVVMQRCSRQQILELMRTVCTAIQAAHQRGVIHRDLKPSNILVSADGQPHVVDFGLAKTLLEGDSRHPISIEGDVAGTPAYMSPEQAAGRVSEVDTRSDVYSLGVILYQLLTGSTPHDTSGTSFQIMKRIVEEEPRTPRSISRTVDREIEALLLKALARDPESRYASAGALADDIGNYLRGDPLTARKTTTYYFLLKRIRKHRVPLSVAGVIALAVAAFGFQQYNQKVEIPISTDPRGAALLVDGHPHACNTPCRVLVGPGVHQILIKHPDEENYFPTKRVVEVKWGRWKILTENSGLLDAAPEPVVLTPRYQWVIFSANVPDAEIELRDANDTVVFRKPMPQAIKEKVSAGKYLARAIKPGYVDRDAEIPMNITGSIQTRLEERILVPADSSLLKD
jgi:serine/threonine protein kinase